MRLAKLIQNLGMGKPPKPEHAVKVGGKPTRWAPYVLKVMIENDTSVLDNLRALRRVKEETLERRLTEARRRQAALKSSLFSVILSEV